MVKNFANFPLAVVAIFIDIFSYANCFHAFRPEVWFSPYPCSCTNLCALSNNCEVMPKLLNNSALMERFKYVGCLDLS
jgi:hypothetical protein